MMMSTPEKQKEKKQAGGGGLFASIREVFSLSVFSTAKKAEEEEADNCPAYECAYRGRNTEFAQIFVRVRR